MLFLQTVTIVKRPICPTFVHDDTTRMVICVVGTLLCIYLHYRILKYFNT